MKNTLKIVLIVCLSIVKCFALKMPILAQSNDKVKEIEKYNQLFIDNYVNNITLSLDYILQAKKLAFELEDDSLRNKWVGETAKNTGIAYDIKEVSNKSLENYFIAIRAGEQSKDLILLQKVYNNIGTLYGTKGNNEKSILYFEESAKLCMEIGEIDEAITSYLNILSINIRIGDESIILDYYNFIGELIRRNQKQAEYQERLDELMVVHYSHTTPEKAIPFFIDKLEFMKGENDTLEFSSAYLNLGILYENLNDYVVAKKYLDSALKYAKFNDDLRIQIRINNMLTGVNIILENHDDAIESFELYKKLRDSLITLEGGKALIEMQTKYDTDKKEKENELLRKQGEIDTLEITSQRNKAFYLYGGLGIALVLILIILNRFVVSQRQKKQIEIQKQEVELQKELIEEKNTEITDSINYAQRIQKALLKSEEHVTNKFPPHFILFKPKDIVSGDFYWVIEKQGYLYVSVADCTGHGVPGAFMSMLGISFLNEINSVDKILSPAEILDELRARIIKELSQDGSFEGSKDGMDMCIMRLKLEENQLEWAGANNSLYIVKNKELEEIKADRQPVAYADHAKPFINHQIQLNKNDTLYMFSDGYVDQFGGPKGKKFKAKRFKEMLLSIVGKPMNFQKKILDETFEKWRYDIEQIDDVCVIGMTIV